MRIPKADRAKEVLHRGHDIFDRFRRAYSSKEPTPPPISQTTAIWLVILFTFLYVAPFYLSENLRTSSRLSRNSPQSIKARTRSVWLTCLLSTVITLYVLVGLASVHAYDIPRLLGLWPVNVLSVVRVQSLVTILFLGPLFEHIIVNGACRSWLSWHLIRDAVFDDWCGYRNLIVGPVSEEYIFRALATSLFLLSRTDARRFLWTSPMIFGLAHVHHFNEAIISSKSMGQSYLGALFTPAVFFPALIRTLVQFSYTTLFGVFETFVLLRTGNLYACILTHTFCNWIGLPRFWGRVGFNSAYHHDHVDLNPPSPSSKRDDDDNAGVLDTMKRKTRIDSLAASSDGDGIPIDPSSIQSTIDSSMYTKRPLRRDSSEVGLQWTFVYYILLGTGALGFTKLLWPLTASNGGMALAQL